LESESYNGIGLMSGTSLDGLDVAEVQFQQTEKEWTFRLVKAQHFDFPKSLSENLFNADKHTASGLVQCDLEFSRFSAKAVNELRQHSTQRLLSFPPTAIPFSTSLN